MYIDYSTDVYYSFPVIWNPDNISEYHYVATKVLTGKGVNSTWDESPTPGTSKHKNGNRWYQYQSLTDIVIKQRYQIIQYVYWQCAICLYQIGSNVYLKTSYFWHQQKWLATFGVKILIVLWGVSPGAHWLKWVSISHRGVYQHPCNYQYSPPRAHKGYRLAIITFPKISRQYVYSGSIICGVWIFWSDCL